MGVKDYGVDLLQGIGLILQARSNPMIIANEMRPLAQSIALDPKGTWNSITQPITDSFKDNMIYGDFTSQARYSTYMLLSVADIFFDTHGAGVAAKSTSTLSKVGKITKVPSPAL